MNLKKANKIKRIKEHNAAYMTEQVRQALCCKNHVRTSQQTYEGKYPPSHHAPSCSHYIAEEYKEVSIYGLHKFICSAEQFYKLNADAIKAGDKEKITVKDVILTIDQVEKLNGFKEYDYRNYIDS